MFSIADLRTDIPNLPEPVISTIRHDAKSNRVSIIDVFRVLTGASSSDASTDLERIISANIEVASTIIYCKFPGQGQRDTPVCDFPTLQVLVAHLVSKARMASHIKQDIMTAFGIDALVMTSPIESDTIAVIIDAFAHLSPCKQFSVPPYRVDLYLKDAGVAIECDEHDHASYDAEADADRTAYITERTGCFWVRFNPHAAGFRIGTVINQIVRLLN